MAEPRLDRRRLLRAAGGVGLSIPAAWLLAACEDGLAQQPVVAAPSVGPLTGSAELGQTGTVLHSQLVAPPQQFVRPLPLPPALSPVRRTATADHYAITARAGTAEILPGLETGIWGYDGTFPGPLFTSRRGKAVHVRLANELPVPVVRHLHGGHTPAASDGYPLDFVLPTAGFDGHVHPGGRVHRGSFEHVYPLPQRASLLWYHDHRMDFSGPQVWKGLVGLHVHRDEEEDALGLPSGDHELPLLVCDRSFGPSGELLYPSKDPSLRHEHGVTDAFSNGVLGDMVLVNGVHAPFHEVRQGTYRLRMAVASNARHYRFTLDPLPPEGEPFVMIGSDGGLMAAPAVVRSFLMAPAERVDVVVDFSSYAVGERVVLTNLSGAGGTVDVLEFRVTGPDDRPPWRPPERLSEVERLRPQDAVRTRRFVFSRVPTAAGPEFRIGHHTFGTHRVAAAPRHGDIEIWELTSDFAHPVHVHNVHFQVLDDDGPAAWKDVVSLSSNDAKRIITRFDSYRGRYILHCHNLEHEDMGMMANFDIT